MTWQLHNEVRAKHPNKQTNKQNNSWRLTSAGRTINAKGLKHVRRKVRGLNACDVLLITGGSVHHGNEENLPKTESKCSMCQGQRSV